MVLFCRKSDKNCAESLGLLVIKNEIVTPDGSYLDAAAVKVGQFGLMIMTSMDINASGSRMSTGSGAMTEEDSPLCSPAAPPEDGENDLRGPRGGVALSCLRLSAPWAWREARARLISAGDVVKSILLLLVLFRGSAGGPGDPGETGDTGSLPFRLPLTLSTIT